MDKRISVGEHIVVVRGFKVLRWALFTTLICQYILLCIASHCSGDLLQFTSAHVLIITVFCSLIGTVVIMLGSYVKNTA